MKTISVVNHKGGVGKTTTALNFGAELADRGYKVLLIDFDMQGNLTKGTGVNGGQSVDKLHHTTATAIEAVLDDDVPDLKSHIYHSANPSAMPVDVIPCNISMGNTMMKLHYVMARESYLKKVVDLIEKECDYDFCIIDNAPSVEIDFQNALVASDEILIVSNPDIFSTEGMTSLITEYSKVKRFFNPQLQIAGILVNNVDKRTNFAREMVDIIKDNWKLLNVFDTVIPQSIRVRESQAMCSSVMAYEPENPAAIAFSNFVSEYLEKQNSMS